MAERCRAFCVGDHERFRNSDCESLTSDRLSRSSVGQPSRLTARASLRVGWPGGQPRTVVLPKLCGRSTVSVDCKCFTAHQAAGYDGVQAAPTELAIEFSCLWSATNRPRLRRYGRAKIWVRRFVRCASEVSLELGFGDTILAIAHDPLSNHLSLLKGPEDRPVCRKPFSKKQIS